MAAETSEYLSKGSPVLIEGRLKYDTWETDGQKRSKLRVVADAMQMLGSRGGSGERSRGAPDRAGFGDQPAGVNAAGPPPSQPPDDEIPF